MGHEAIVDLIAFTQERSYLFALHEAAAKISAISGLLERPGSRAALGAVWALIDEFIDSEKLDRRKFD